MSSQQTVVTTHHVETPSGRITYASAGSGPVALFVHGVVLNKHLWRHQLVGLSDIRLCIAVDLLAHGDTEITPDQDVSVAANAKMLKEGLDSLKTDQVDLIGNDSGGGIAQIFAALNPERVRTLTLTNCDTHDNWPPEAFKPFVDMVKAGGLRDTLDALLADKTIYRSPALPVQLSNVRHQSLLPNTRRIRRPRRRPPPWVQAAAKNRAASSANSSKTSSDRRPACSGRNRSRYL
jgi:pimeloyl-ACP methyl ester carboxylesterase